MGTQYELTKTRLTLKSSSGGCCGMCQTISVDNVPLRQTTDADVKQLPPPGIHMCCCGSRMDVVTVRDSSGGKQEIKVLRLRKGQGQIVAQMIIR